MRNVNIWLLQLAMSLVCAASAVASTTWYVDGVAGNDSNSCLSPTAACKTIGHAISLAVSGDVIRVAPATYVENLTIDRSLTILGFGARTTIVDGGGVNRVFTISQATAHVTLSRLTIRNGRALGTGGGVLNSGVLRVSASAVTGNTAYNTCTANCGDGGGGITNSTGAKLIITSSTVSGNHALLPCNPILHGCSTLGGGIGNSATASLSNITIAGNSGAIGGAILAGGTVTVQNSILANNFASNCGGGFVVISNGYNLSSDSSCALDGPGDLNNIDPQLGPLQYNGGPTQTTALPSGSPAVDAGNPSGCTDNLRHLLKTDQRGKPRPDSEDTGGCDMGAYERQSD